MYLVACLGNPGREYQGSRHNVGFMVAEALRASEGWPDFKTKFSGVWTRGRFRELGASGPGAGGDDVVLLQPQTYMNLSGESVQPAAAFLKVPPKNVIVGHDELDLAWKDVRLKFGGGHAGNNGVLNIIERLGTAEFVRVRVGVGKPPAGFRGSGADWVLSGFDPVERAELPSVVDAAIAAVRAVVSEGITAAMLRVNTQSGRGGAANGVPKGKKGPGGPKPA